MNNRVFAGRRKVGHALDPLRVQQEILQIAALLLIKAWGSRFLEQGDNSRYTLDSIRPLLCVQLGNGLVCSVGPNGSIRPLETPRG